MNAEEFSPRATALALLAALVLAGCAVGPDFKRPESSTPDVFQRLQSAQSESRPVDAEFNADWWTLLNDPLLNELEDRLAQANLDVAAASARLGQSRATQQVVGAAQLPKLDGAAFRACSFRISPTGPRVSSSSVRRSPFRFSREAGSRARCVCAKRSNKRRPSSTAIRCSRHGVRWMTRWSLTMPSNVAATSS